MECPICNLILDAVETKIRKIKTRLVTYQCLGCGYFDLDDESAGKILAELDGHGR